MANKIISFRDFSPSSASQYFFDTNIWMLLFCPLGNIRKEKQERASKLLSYIISANGAIIITSLILSEFSNAYLRIAFEQWRKLPRNVGGKFKTDYFKTEDAVANRRAITSAIYNIVSLKCVKKFPDDFNNTNLSNLLKNFQVVDFNDCFIMECCKKSSFILITDDKDFEKVDSGINIVNLNKKAVVF